jgi:hypothetical protein
MRRGQEILIDLEGIESGTKSSFCIEWGIREKDAVAGNFFLRTVFLLAVAGDVIFIEN